MLEGNLHFHRNTVEALRFWIKKALDCWQLLFHFSSMCLFVCFPNSQLKSPCFHRHFKMQTSKYKCTNWTSSHSLSKCSHLLLVCIFHLIKLAILILVKLHVHSYILKNCFQMKWPSFFFLNLKTCLLKVSIQCPPLSLYAHIHTPGFNFHMDMSGFLLEYACPA